MSTLYLEQLDGTFSGEHFEDFGIGLPQDTAIGANAAFKCLS